MPTHYHLHSWDNRGPNALTGTTAITADSEINLDAIVTSVGSPVTINFNVAAAQIKALYISCAHAVTLVTDGDPADTITVPAGEAVAWHAASGADCPIQEDMTAFAATTAASSTTVHIRALLDSTP